MKKKFVAMIVGLSMLLCSCGITGTTYEEAINETANTETYAGGYFTIITEWFNANSHYYIVYANDSKVKYYIETTGQSRAITPLYNTDGSLQIYEGAEN